MNLLKELANDFYSFLVVQLRIYDKSIKINTFDLYSSFQVDSDILPLVYMDSENKNHIVTITIKKIVVMKNIEKFI